MAGGAVVAIGLGTGGVGLVVIGLFAAAGAYLGGEGGKLFMKNVVTDNINKRID